MVAISLPPPIWVDRPQALRQAIDRLSVQPILAVDTESNSLYAYRERVCLIQFSFAETDYLIDPLALTDLSGLEAIFADPAIEKVFHAAEYDLICLKRDFGFHFANLFDTMQAARILGRPAIGLGSLLKEEFGLNIDKRFQRANWGQRPLPAEMLSYARLDTHYLIALRNRLYEALEARGLLPLAQEDFRRACSVNGKAGNGESDPLWRISGTQELDPRQMGVLNELVKYREERAREADLPPFKVLDNQALLAIARALPRSREELIRAVRLSDRQLQRHGDELLAAVQRGLRANPPHRPQSSPYDEALVARMEALRTWRRDKGLEWGVESDVILPRDVMQAIAERGPRSLDELAAVMSDLPWRLEHFGAEILKVLP